MTYLLLGVSIILTVISQLLLKKGVFGTVDFGLPFGELILSFLKNPFFLSGVVSFGLAFILWILVLSKMKLSVAYPISTALNLSLVAIVSYFFFKEQLSLIQMAGILTIIFGIFLLLWKA